jgi:PAS domain S-box-containing protein
LQQANAAALAREAALTASAGRLRAVVERAPIILVAVSRDGTVELSEGRGLADLGLRPGQLVGNSMRELLAERPDWLAILERALKGEEVKIEMDWGGRLYDAHYAPDLDEAGGMRGVIIVSYDVTERWRVEQALQATQRRLSSFFVESPAGMALYDLDGRLIQLNPTFARMVGAPAEELLGARPRDYFTADSADQVEALMRDPLETGQPQINQEFSGTLAADPRKMRHWLYSLFPVPNADRKVEALGLIVTETTALKEAEARLRQTQRLEAVGTLTGGVAHDFNNLLAVISGNLELMSEGLAARPDLRQKAEAALRATDRGATLTRSLLAFSRQQALLPAPVDLNRLVADMSDLFRRTIPASISLSVVGAPGLWACKADAGQLQNALLNLVVNARDAMPDGGSIAITTSNVTLAEDDAAVQAEVIPGEYVMLAVRDTGTGMPADVVAQAFVPFFTTKEVGKGTGLGLSMVYGFAKQSEGHVTIESEVGAGTAGRIYLPRFREKGAQGSRLAPKGGSAGGGEKLLVVEDDPDVLSLLSAQLASLGYQVLRARDGMSALAALEANNDVALLLSDVILPGRMTGPQIADRARAIRPELPVVYMSGYTDNAIPQNGAAPASVRLLQKPFTKSELAAVIRAALDERR